MKDDLEEIVSIVVGDSARSEGWYTLEQIRDSMAEFNTMSRNGLYHRLSMLVDSKKLETKMAYFQESSRWKRVWRPVPSQE